MPELISKLTGMVTSTATGFLTLLAAVAVFALLVWALVGFTSGDDHKKLAAGKAIVAVIVFCAVAACATPMVSWVLTV